MVQTGRLDPLEFQAIILRINANRQRGHRTNPTPTETGWAHMPINGRAVRKGHASRMRDHWRGSNGRQTFYADDSRALEHATLGRHTPR